MKIEKLVVGKLQENCYIVSEADKAIIIDPGDDAQFLIDYLSRNELVPVSIIATHGHFDHVMAVFELKIAYNIPFLMHKDDEFLLARMASSAQYFTGANDVPPAPKVDNYLKDKEEINFGDCKYEVISTPGHTPGSICLYDKKEGLLFSGDLLLMGGVGRVDFSYSDKDKLIKSVKQIMKLPDSTKIYSGHGEESTLSNERNYLKEVLAMFSSH